MEDGWFNEFTFLDEARVEKKFALIPHQCVVTKKWIWLESAIRARRRHIVPSGSRNEDRWFLPQEYTMLALKGGF